MRPILTRLLLLALPLALLSGCGTTRSCGGDDEYLASVERPPIQLPPEITPTERMQPLAIPSVDPAPAKLDPQPRCLDEPPKFFARKAATTAPAAPGVAAAPTAVAATAATAATAVPAVTGDAAEDAVRLWAWSWAERKSDAVVKMYSPSFQAAGTGGAAAFLEQRRQQVETGRSPDARLDEVAVTESSADRRVITFLQRFGEGAVRKEMTLALEGGIWRIVSERTLEVL